MRYFLKLLAMAKDLRKLCLCIDFTNYSDAFDDKTTRAKLLRMLVDELTSTSMREINWADAPLMLGPGSDDVFEYVPPWPGSVWIFEKRES